MKKITEKNFTGKELFPITFDLTFTERRVLYLIEFFKKIGGGGRYGGSIS